MTFHVSQVILIAFTLVYWPTVALSADRVPIYSKPIEPSKIAAVSHNVPSPSKSEPNTSKPYTMADGPDWYAADKMESLDTNKLLMLAQNANYVACYKQVGMKMVLFRWCPIGLPWTATNDNRTNCYATSEACAKAEMPQSWCIKCGNKE